MFSGGLAMWRGWRMIGLVGEYAGSRSVGRPWKRGIDTVKDCLRRGLNVSKARRMVRDRNE